MCDCDLDPINFCCWTHGTDITMEDYAADCCGFCPDDEDYLDDDEFDDCWQEPDEPYINPNQTDLFSGNGK